MSELTERVNEALRAWSDAPVLIEVNGTGGEIPVAAPELTERIAAAASVLTSSGIRRDDVVALFLENSIEFVTILFALISIGAIPVFAKLEYRRVELNTLFLDIDPDAIVTEASHLTILQPYVEGRGVVVLRDHVLSETQGVSRHRAQPGLSEEVASINCTYRGSGELLGSMATHRQYVHGARVLQDGLYGERGERMLYPIPLNHIFTLVGCLFVPLFFGMTGIIARTVHPRVLFATIERLGVHHMTAVPEIYRLLLRSRRESHRHPTLRTFVSGGSHLARGEYEDLALAFSVEVLHGYGLTEFTPVSRNSRGEARGGTVGPVCSGVDVRIESPDGDGRGEILIKSPALCAGYYNRPDATRRAFYGGWFRTGDRGHFDETHLVFDSEIKSTRKLNGVMVDLEEVRRAVVASTDGRVADVIVRGNSLTALLQLTEFVDTESEQRRLLEALKDQIAHYKIPRRVERIP